MCPRRLEQKTPTEKELDDFERRKNASPAAPSPGPNAMGGYSGARSVFTALSVVVIAGFLLTAVMSTMWLRSAAPGTVATKGGPSGATGLPTNTNTAATIPTPGGATAGSAGGAAGASATPAQTSAASAVVRIDDILINPERYVGTNVSVRATVKETISPRACVINEGGGDLLVVSFDSGGWVDSAGGKVIVYGRVGEAGQLPTNVKGDYRGRLALFAYHIAEE